jgi:hypothetical protein
MDTQYTQGFKAGMAWEIERIIKLLDDADSACSGWAIALIRGETNGET